MARRRGARAPAPPQPQPPVVVVGAGIAGLACAIALRKRGVRVLVLERDASAAARMQGFHFHFAENPRLDACLKELGLTEDVASACVESQPIQDTFNVSVPERIFGGSLSSRRELGERRRRVQ